MTIAMFPEGTKLLTSDGRFVWEDAKKRLKGMMCHSKRARTV